MIVPAVSIYEVFKRVLQQKGEDEALQAVAQMLKGEVIPLDTSLALETARISNDLALPMADSIILAMARAHRAIPWTQDEHFDGIRGVRYTSKRSA